MGLIEIMNFVCVIAYISMGIHAYIIRDKRAINGVYLFITLLFAGWSLAGVITSISPREGIAFWQVMSAIVWTLGISAMLHLTVALIYERSKPIKLFIVILFYLPGFMLLVGQVVIKEVHHLLKMDFVESMFGFSGSLAYYVIYVGLTLFLLVNCYKRTNRGLEKRQSIVIGVSLSITFVGMFIYGFFSMGGTVLPRLQPIIMICWIVGLWLAMTKYSLSHFLSSIASNNIIDNVLDIIVISDNNGDIIKANKRVTEVLKYHRNQLIGKDISSIVKGDDAVRAQIQEVLSGVSKGVTIETNYYKSDQTSLPVRLKGVAIRDHSERIIGMMIAAQDLRLQKQLEKMSITDKLTGIHNRLQLERVLDYEIKAAKRQQSQFTIVLLNIDFFRQVNELFGHQKGDNILVEIGKRLQGILRESDTIGRWAGEAFLMILPNTDLEQGCIVAEKTREVLELMDYNIGMKVTASFGVATYEEDMSVEKITALAENALEEAKKKGRNQVCFTNN